jgi:RAD50-interacting protein 1
VFEYDLSHAHGHACAAQLSESQAQLDALLLKTRNDIKLQLNRAQELSLLRHTVSDELSYLSQELVSSFSDDNTNSTLLEDIEILHRSLKELQSVRDYVQIIRHALSVRYAFNLTKISLSLCSP